MINISNVYFLTIGGEASVAATEGVLVVSLTSPEAIFSQYSDNSKKGKRN